MTLKLRQPMVAGIFYPASKDDTLKAVHTLLQDAKNNYSDLPQAPKALICPHAGYIYSGSVAAMAYLSLIPIKDQIKRVILFGPAHRYPVNGIATTMVDGFLTSVGTSTVNKQAINQALLHSSVNIIEEAFQGEHCLEVQLPFLQQILTDFTIVPFLVGLCQPQLVQELMHSLYGGPETIIIVSSDLSHYHDYDTACTLDANTTDAILKLNPDAMQQHSACGKIPIQGLLLLAKRLNLIPQLIKQNNSGDTAGDKQRVVGYGAYSFS